ncbi:hypothetical protein P825_02252 [Klebsiella pneumoniae UCI 22]|nr:hypothetical protein P825_02252 [Klebsiella pneumoniae UCI 22]
MFAGKKSAQIREILISESAWEEMTCLFAPSLDGFAQHARRLREIIAFAKIELHDELRNGNLYATRHRVLCTRRSGEEVDMEVYMFAEIDDSGRFIRIEEATLMLKGRESDRDLGSVR